MGWQDFLQQQLQQHITLRHSRKNVCIGMRHEEENKIT